jgi:NADPH-dependent 2,4-dienoyl-CoA reductase/sulfur reductase-like enzyme
MSDVLIIGGGFAGVWCAAGAVRLRRLHGAAESELRVTLIDGSDDIVIRPRLYEAGPEQMRVSLDRILGPIGVRRVAATVTDIDTAARRVSAVGATAGPRSCPTTGWCWRREAGWFARTFPAPCTSSTSTRWRGRPPSTPICTGFPGSPPVTAGSPPS